jgi:hypothetical protein
MKRLPIPEMVDRYFKFIEDRHAIYIARQDGKSYPWTDDPILKTYKFTNVFRQLDTGTIWYTENIAKPHAESPALFFHTCAYRMMNFWPTYEQILKELGFFEEFDKVKFGNVLRKRKHMNQKVFTSAHMITGTLGGDKIHQVVDLGMQEIWDFRNQIVPQLGDSLESAYNRLMDFHVPGIGPFIAYEIITDLRHTRYLEHADDIMSWANPGPGAMRGMDRIYGVYRKNEKYQTTTREVYIAIMNWLLEKSPEHLADWVPTMEMRDIEHSLCEFDKYERVRLGQGKPRQKYQVGNK